MQCRYGNTKHKQTDKKYVKQPIVPHKWYPNDDSSQWNRTERRPCKQSMVFTQIEAGWQRPSSKWRSYTNLMRMKFSIAKRKLLVNLDSAHWKVENLELQNLFYKFYILCNHKETVLYTCHSGTILVPDCI